MNYTLGILPIDGEVKTGLAEHLDGIVGKSRYFELAIRFLLEHGRDFESARLSRNRGPAGYCFATAARRAKSSECVYVEGFATWNGLGYHHAWLWDPSAEEVIETTWEEPAAAYFGVPFRRPAVGSTILTLENLQRPELMVNAVYRGRSMTSTRPH